MTRYKRVFFYGLMAALTLAAVEGMARLAYFLAFDEGYGGGWQMAAAEFSPQEHSDNRRVILYPFYGYTPYSPYADMNLAPPPPKPAFQGDGIVVIGLIGGSVAREVRVPFRRAINRYFAANALPGQPVVVPLGVNGMRQPGQTMTIANLFALGGHFDILVNLDGYNEINLGEGRFVRRSRRSPFYPRSWSTGLTDGAYRLIGRIGILREQEKQRRREADSSPFRPTALYGLLNRYRLERTRAAIIELNHELAGLPTTYTLELHGPRQHYWKDAAISREKAQGWYRASLLLAEMAELAGAEYYHFQQPNQYVPGAKPLNAEELACCYAAGSLKERAYREGYPALRQLGERMRQNGVNYFDLNGIFADNQETVYRDECCHFTERGNELLAAAMVERLAPALHKAANAGPRVSPLTAAARPWPEELGTGRRLIDADFRVYRRAGRWLRYVKEGCSAREAESWFFLHIVPADRGDLPPERREVGFDNRDFRFENGGIMLNKQCLAEQLLPDYPMASFRTGQFSWDGDKLWEEEYRFQEYRDDRPQW